MKDSQRKAMYAKQSNSNNIAYDIFLSKDIQKRLPSGWKYTKFRDHVKRLADNPKKYPLVDLEKTYKFNQIVIDYYNNHNWILGSKSTPTDNALHVGSRVSNLTSQQFKLFIGITQKKRDTK